jgi:hypothetical protein
VALHQRATRRGAFHAPHRKDLGADRFQADGSTLGGLALLFLVVAWSFVPHLLHELRWTDIPFESAIVGSKADRVELAVWLALAALAIFAIAAGGHLRSSQTRGRSARLLLLMGGLGAVGINLFVRASARMEFAMFGGVAAFPSDEPAGDVDAHRSSCR